MAQPLCRTARHPCDHELISRNACDVTQNELVWPLLHGYFLKRVSELLIRSNLHCQKDTLFTLRNLPFTWNHWQTLYNQWNPYQFYLKSSGRKRKYQVTGKKDSSQKCQLERCNPIINNIQSVCQDHSYTNWKISLKTTKWRANRFPKRVIVHRTDLCITEHYWAVHWMAIDYLP